MAIIKKKSVIVVLVSVAMLCSVIVLTLSSFFVYTVYKGVQDSLRYQYELDCINAKFYSKYVKLDDLRAEIKTLSTGREIAVKGRIRNSGYRSISFVFANLSFINKHNISLHSANIAIRKTIGPGSEGYFTNKVELRLFHRLDLLARILPRKMKV